MKTFSIGLSGELIDLESTFQCGQVFRWKKDDNDYWCGNDGDNSFRLRIEAVGLDCATTGTEGDVRSLLQIGGASHRAVNELRVDEFSDYVARSEGVRMLKTVDSVETFCAFLCTANNHLARIVPMVTYLGSLGDPLNGSHRFPELEVIANYPEDLLRAKGFGYRAKTIPIACRAAIERGGREWLGHLSNVPYHEAFSELLAIPGFGPKLTDCVLLYGCGHGEAVPVDTHVWQMMQERVPEFQSKKSLTYGTYREVGDWFRDRFGILAGTVQQRAFAGRLFSKFEHNSKALSRKIEKKFDLKI